MPEGRSSSRRWRSPTPCPTRNGTRSARTRRAGRGDPSAIHLKLLLDRIGVARGEVEPWPAVGRAASPAVRGRAVANAMTAPISATNGARCRRRAAPDRHPRAELADPARARRRRSRSRCARRSKPRARPPRWSRPTACSRARLGACSRAGESRPTTAPASRCRRPRGHLAARDRRRGAEELAPVPLLALAQASAGRRRGRRALAWLDAVRALDLALRGPRPRAGLAGLDAHFADRKAPIGLARAAPERSARRCSPRSANPRRLRSTLADLAAALRDRRRTRSPAMPPGAARRPHGRRAHRRARSARRARARCSTADDAVPMLRAAARRDAGPPALWRPSAHLHLGPARSAAAAGRPDDPRRAERGRLAGAAERPTRGSPPQDPRALGLPGLEFRTGLAAHDFMSALGAPRVLLTRARRDSRSPTVASRFWLRLQAMTGGLARDSRLERWRGARRPRPAFEPVDRPAPARRSSSARADRRHRPRPAQGRSVRFLRQAILKLRALDPVDADHTAAWKGTAVHEVLEQWLKQDDCDPAKLGRAPRRCSPTRHPPDAARLVAPRLIEAIDWIAAGAPTAREKAARPRPPNQKFGEAEIAGVTLTARSTASTGSPTAAGDRRLQDRQGRRAEGGRRRLRAAARPARPDRRAAASKASPASRARSNIGRWPRTAAKLRQR
jgi:ATP-dependent helicase/nuclease subunit B